MTTAKEQARHTADSNLADFTPGPWEYVPSTEHHGPYVCGPHGGDICDCYVMSRPDMPAVRNGGPSKPIHFFGEMADPNARLIAAAPALLEALEGLLARDVQNTCVHEDTHRGGSIWEICNDCDAMWADDKGGKPEWEDPPEWARARTAISAARGEQRENS